jgi:hypothetical protein
MMPPQISAPLYANYPAEKLTIGAGVAIFHIATERVVVVGDTSRCISPDLTFYHSATTPETNTTFYLKAVGMPTRRLAELPSGKASRSQATGTDSYLCR